jgi:putative ABC transport system permease protein
VSASFSPAYDLLVRPRGARTALENKTRTVQPDFLSGIYGGITMAQYHQVQQVPGVQVAALMARWPATRSPTPPVCGRPLPPALAAG